MKKNPVLIFTGLAILAAGAVVGVTRDRWTAPEPQAEASNQTVSEKADQQKTETAQNQTAETQQPAQPAAPAEPAKPAEVASTEQPATTTAETPTQPAQPAAQPEATPPAASTESQPAAPAATTEAQPATPVAPESKATPPTFDTVRVEKTGDAVIAGRAPAGSEVVVMLDGNEIGKATANDDGAFVVVPNAPLPSGSGTLRLKSKPAGQTDAMESEQSVAVVVPAGQSEEAMVAVLSPNEPTRVLQKPAAQTETQAETPAEQPKAAEPTQQAATPAAQPETQPQQPAVQPEAQQPAAQPAPPAQVSIAQVSLDAVDYDAAGNITFSGTAAPGATARLYVDNNFLGDATAGSDGRWVFNGSSPITPGIHSLRVDGVDANGAVTSRVEQPFFREEQSKVASAEQPQQPAEPEHSEPIPAPATPAAEEGKTDQQAVAPATPAAPATTAETPAAPVATAETPAAQPSPAVPREGRIVIQPGNNLWRISKVIYGTGVKYSVIYKANKDLIRNPNLIYPGQVFRTPDIVPPETIDPKRRDTLKPEETQPAGQ